MVAPTQKWGTGITLKHHCGVCHTPLTSPTARTTCIGRHVEPCWRYHDSLFMLGRTGDCKTCHSGDEAHKKRHKAIAQKLYEVSPYTGTQLIQAARVEECPRDPQTRELRPAREVSEGRRPLRWNIAPARGAQGKEDEDPAPKTSLRERKLASNIAKAQRSKNIRSSVVPTTVWEHIGSKIHKCEAGTDESSEIKAQRQLADMLAESKRAISELRSFFGLADHMGDKRTRLAVTDAEALIVLDLEETEKERMRVGERKKAFFCFVNRHFVSVSEQTETETVSEDTSSGEDKGEEQPGLPTVEVEDSWSIEEPTAASLIIESTEVLEEQTETAPQIEDTEELEELAVANTAESSSDVLVKELGEELFLDNESLLITIAELKELALETKGELDDWVLVVLAGIVVLEGLYLPRNVPDALEPFPSFSSAIEFGVWSWAVSITDDPAPESFRKFWLRIQLDFAETARYLYAQALRKSSDSVEVRDELELDGLDFSPFAVKRRLETILNSGVNMRRQPSADGWLLNTFVRRADIHAKTRDPHYCFCMKIPGEGELECRGKHCPSPSYHRQCILGFLSANFGVWPPLPPTESDHIRDMRRKDKEFGGCCLTGKSVEEPLFEEPDTRSLDMTPTDWFCGGCWKLLKETATKVCKSN